MDVRILRSVGPAGRAGAVRLPSERARSLLVALAWRPGEVVADESAIRRVWEEKLPRHPRDCLYTCANRLRAAMDEAEPGAGGALVRQRGGYLLDLPVEQVDLHHSRGLIRRAQAAARDGDPASALGLYDRALQAWGDVPLAGVGTLWAHGARVGLSRERLTAQIGRAEAALTLGRGREELPFVQRLAEEHPLDESVTALLMVALSRSGRVGEALGCFTALRTRMLRELGDEPGEPLHELHTRILRRDASVRHVMAAMTRTVA